MSESWSEPCFALGLGQKSPTAGAYETVGVRIKGTRGDIPFKRNISRISKGPL